MKTRNGFVSNSSSTSFVVLIPDSFDPEKYDWQKLHDDRCEDCTYDPGNSGFLIKHGLMTKGNMSR